VLKELLSTVITKKLRYFGYVIRKIGDCLKKRPLEAHYQEKNKKTKPETS